MSTTCKRGVNQNLDRCEGRVGMPIGLLNLPARTAMKLLHPGCRLGIRLAQPTGFGIQIPTQGRRLRPNPDQMRAGRRRAVAPSIRNIRPRHDQRSRAGPPRVPANEKRRMPGEHHHAGPPVVQAQWNRVSPVKPPPPRKVKKTARRLAPRQPVRRTRTGRIKFTKSFHKLAFYTTHIILLANFPSAMGQHMPGFLTMKILPRFTFGMGDRFGHEGEAQLSAVMDAAARGIHIFPVWNKSNREHTIVGTKPPGLRAEADAAVKALGWTGDYFVDADHINLHTVDSFLECSDFFTLDVADYVGQPAAAATDAAFLARHSNLIGTHRLPRFDDEVTITLADLERTAKKFLGAIQEAGRIHRHIAKNKTGADFAIEVSVDETDTPQTPAELLIILAMIADEGIPAQTIAPKFTGRFNKGVDYAGNIATFEREFDADLAVLAHAVEKFGLPNTLKVSVHSGSDKFSLYPIIRRLVEKHGAGLHLKTAGTTWLEEVAGLAEAGGEGLALAHEIYARAHSRAGELIKPYEPVVDINIPRLPSVGEVRAWSPDRYLAALVHDQTCPQYDPQFRQFIHVSFKIAAEIGTPFLDALKTHRKIVARRVKDNLLKKHIEPLFA